MHSLLHYKGGVDRKQRIVTHIVLVLLLFFEQAPLVLFSMTGSITIFSFSFWMEDVELLPQPFLLRLQFDLRLIFFRTFSRG